MSTFTKLLRSLGISRVSDLRGVEEYRLDSNGLKVLLVPNSSAPVVSTMVMYRVGSRNEAVGYTGSTHFLEHMMFKGTETFNPADGTGVMETFGPLGALLNATTSDDRTNYFECVPKAHLELTLQVEADRMRNLVLRKEDRDSEMTVVRNEFERGENNPMQVMLKEINAMAFREHPYHHPTIGWLSDVEGVPMERMREFYNTYYWPNNATVIIVGDFDRAEALTHVVKHFGKIPASENPIPEVYTVEPEQEGERRFEINRPTQQMPMVCMAFHVPEAEHDDTFALDAAAQILGGSRKSSRLYKALVETGKAVHVSTWSGTNRDPGLFMVFAMCAPGVLREELEQLLTDEIHKLTGRELATDAELGIVKSANRKATKLQRDDPMRFASLLCQGEAVADWRWVMQYDDRFDGVTADDIKGVVEKYLVKRNRTVGFFIPQPVETADATDGAAASASNEADNSFAARVKKHVLPNGLTVLAMATPGTGTVSVSGAIHAGEAFAPTGKALVPELTAYLLTRGGSEGMSSGDAAAVLDAMATKLEFRADSAHTINFGSSVVSGDLAAYLDTLTRVITSPVFDAGAFEMTRGQFSAFISQAASDTEKVASSELSRALYDQGVVFHDPDFESLGAELAELSRDDLVAFHKAAYSPAGTVITIVGDIDTDRVLELLPVALKDWTGPDALQVEAPVVHLPDQARRIDVPMPGKKNVDIIVGLPAMVDYRSDDYRALKLASAALGQDTIASRLGKIVRVREGLTYGINSKLGDLRVAGSPWTITVSTNPENVERVLSLIDEIVGEYCKSGISEEELADEKGRAYGQFAVSLRTPLGIASALTVYEVNGLGADIIDGLEAAYQAVTKAEVDAAIAKYFRLDKAVTVVAGTTE